MSKSFQLGLYGLSSAAFGFGFWVLMNDTANPMTLAYGSHFQYLTILGMAVTTLGQNVGLLATITSLRALHSLKDKINLLACPLAFLISILYWSIRAVDRDLLLDPRIQVVPPMWLDLTMHVLPAIVELIDVVWFGQLWTASVAQILPLFGVFSAGYWYWVHHTFDRNGFFPYPLMGLVTTAQRAQIFLAATVVVCLSYSVVKSIQSTVRKGSGPTEEEKKKMM